jgi:hypothetical protein
MTDHVTFTKFALLCKIAQLLLYQKLQTSGASQTSNAEITIFKTTYRYAVPIPMRFPAETMRTLTYITHLDPFFLLLLPFLYHTTHKTNIAAPTNANIPTPAPCVIAAFFVWLAVALALALDAVLVTVFVAVELAPLPLVLPLELPLEEPVIVVVLEATVAIVVEAAEADESVGESIANWPE